MEARVEEGIRYFIRPVEAHVGRVVAEVERPRYGRQGERPERGGLHVQHSPRCQLGRQRPEHFVAVVEVLDDVGEDDEVIGRIRNDV
jgi:hypothetical protein